jgi:hypothetical protein
MDDQRRDQGGIIVVGCFVVALFFAVLMLGVLWVRLGTSRAIYEERQATIEAQTTQQVSAVDEEKPIPPQETPEPPEVK